jgi:hypothetical protein
MADVPDPNTGFLPPDASPAPAPLAFDKADFAGNQALQCKNCARTIDTRYYEVNGVVVCEPCRVRLDEWLVDRPLENLPKSILLGLGAAFVGGLAWFLVQHFAHLQVGLISILCGWLVGTAVRRGSGNRGGWPYQVVAVALTYVSVGGAIAAELFFDPSLAGKAISPALVLISVVAGPWFGGFMGTLIFGFGLWRALRMNAKAVLAASGPFDVRPPTAA